jgi:signal transduction histidine kinase
MVAAEPLEPGAVDAAALQFVAEGVTELAGFELAALSIVHDRHLHTVALAGGDGADAELSTVHTPVDALLAELEHAEDWGSLKFVPHERDTSRLAPYSYVPDVVPVDAPDAWHPRDLLVALLEDGAGELRGVLSVDVPRNGLRPDEEQRRVIELYARQAGRAVITLLERQEFEQGLRRERATSDYRGHLIDALSHQLQNPVAAILGNLEIMLEDLAPGDPSERPLRGIERATARIAAMVKDLLLLAKVNNPDRPLHEVEVDLGLLTREVADALGAEAVGGGIALDLVEPDAPMLVLGDPGELEDLVVNLVSNAIKFSDPGGSVTVALTGRIEEATPYVELRVSDRGIGIAEDEMDRLFEEFFRSERPAARARPGTGLGLPVVDRVVNRHRGRIEVESELDVGTTFRVLLLGLPSDPARSA